MPEYKENSIREVKVQPLHLNPCQIIEEALDTLYPVEYTQDDIRALQDLREWGMA